MTDIKINYEEPIFTISAAAKLLSVSVHTLRMYERKGLFIAFKENSHQRLFSKADIERIECIRRTINELKISINGIKTIYSLIPCWTIFKCSKEEREKCVAFNSYNEPCWCYNHPENVCEKQDCRDCEIYKKYSDCSKIKVLLKTIAK